MLYEITGERHDMNYYSFWPCSVYCIILNCLIVLYIAFRLASFGIFRFTSMSLTGSREQTVQFSHFLIQAKHSLPSV